MIDRITPDETTQAPPASQDTDWRAMFERMRDAYEHERAARLAAEDECDALSAELERVRVANRRHVEDDLYRTALLANDDKGMQEADKLFHIGLRKWQRNRVAKHDDYTGPDDLRYLRFYRNELSQICGKSDDWVTDRLNRAEEMGTINRDRKTRPPTGESKRPDTALYLAFTTAFEQPSDMHIEARGKGRGGNRRCVRCGSQRVHSRVLVRERTCSDCGHVEIESVNEPEPMIEDDGEKQPQPTTRPAPIPFPARPHPQPEPMPKAATPCPLDPRGLHEYAARRDARGRRVCIECGEAEPMMREEMH